MHKQGRSGAPGVDLGYPAPEGQSSSYCAPEGSLRPPPPPEEEVRRAVKQASDGLVFLSFFLSVFLSPGPSPRPLLEAEG